MILLIALPVFIVATIICWKTRQRPIVVQLPMSLAALTIGLAIIIPHTFTSQYNKLQKEKDELEIEIRTYDYKAVPEDVTKRKIERFNENYKSHKSDNWRWNILAVFQNDPEDLSFPDDYLDNVLKERKEKDKESSSEENKEERKKVEIDGKEYELVPIS